MRIQTLLASFLLTMPLTAMAQFGLPETRLSMSNTPSRLSELCAVSNTENWNHSDQNGVTGVTNIEMKNTLDAFRFQLESKLNLPRSGLVPALENSVHGNHERDLSLDLQFETFMTSFKEKDLRYWIGELFGPLTCNPVDVGCMRAFEKGLSATRSNAFLGDFLSLPETIREIRDYAVYSKASALLALTVLDKVAKAGVTPSFLGNLYEDAYNAFARAGVPEPEINHHVIQLLSVYGMRGSTVEAVLSIPFEFQDHSLTAFESMSFISNAINYLDSISLKTGHMYSLPANVSNSCLYTRPYHFWMAAAVAHQIQSAGYSAGATFRAAHRLSVDYELVGSTANKTATNVFTKDYYRLETQKNIAFNDAGSLWAISGGKENISIDKFLSEMLRKEKTDVPDWAKLPGPMNSVKISAFGYWRNRTGSEANLAAVEEILGRTWLIRKAQ